MRTVEVVDISTKTGGSYRASMILRYRNLHGIDCSSVLLGEHDRVLADSLLGCPPVGHAYLMSLRRLLPFLPRRWAELLSSVKALLPDRDTITKRVDITIEHHETVECAKATLLVSEVLETKRVLILQLPPFYGNPPRRKNIEKAYSLYLDAWKSCGEAQDYIARFVMRRLDALTEKSYITSVTDMLKRFDLLVAVSKSIPVDIGIDLRNLVALNAGIGFDSSELEFLRSLRSRTIASAIVSEPYAMYSARLDPSKGFIEALMVTKIVKRRVPTFKLLMTGGGSSKMIELLNRLVKRLDLKDNVSYLGFLPRRDALEVRRGARVFVYPSHVDAYPYAVAESLVLGVPVVAFDIPALALNYGCIDGLFLVDEGDVEAMAQKVLEAVEAGNVAVDMPRIYTIHEVIAEEVGLLKRFVLRV